MANILKWGAGDLGRLPGSVGPRKILFVYPFCGLGGVETATLTKIAALRRFGIEASVLFSKFYGDGARAFASHHGVTVGLDDDGAVSLVLGGKFDAISIIDYPDFFDLLDRHGVQIPILFETHCAVPHALDRFYRPLNNPKVRAIIVPSRHNRQLIGERVNPRCEILIVPNTVDVRAFRPGIRSPKKIREILDREKVVLWIGRLEDEKNPRELIDVAERLLRRMRGVRFVVVGDLPDEYEERKKRLLDSMTASTRKAFTFIKAVPYDEMPDLYREVRQTRGVLLSTSLYESLPMTFVEAMACGCPVLSSDVGGVRDIITDGVTGRLYDTGNIDEAVRVLHELLTPANYWTVERLTRNARRRVVRNRASTVAAREYMRLLDRIAVTDPGDQNFPNDR
jgi:glycosyltransferase involved in cell wall biosynthesis